MDFRILGPLEVDEAGRAIQIVGGRQRALLAILLIHANEAVSAGRLIDELWAEHAPDNPRKGLQVQVSRLPRGAVSRSGSPWLSATLGSLRSSRPTSKVLSSGSG